MLLFCAFSFFYRELPFCMWSRNQILIELLTLLYTFPPSQNSWYLQLCTSALTGSYCLDCMCPKWAEIDKLGLLTCVPSISFIEYV